MPTGTTETGRRPGAIRELVAVRDHPTVVRLDHLEGDDAGWIRDAFFVTPALEGHLAAVRHALGREAGSGIFLVGSYGSGKSHLLAYLTQALRAGELVDDPPAVAPLSLVNFRGAQPLEEIVCSALGVDLPEGDRRAAWAGLAERHPEGLLLVLDELSEFLRSKPDDRAFAEDIRFLQFLGEQAQGSRLWILAALQEQIEHTGELDYSLYRKIKDRFPLRLLLTPTHVEELLAGSILQKADGYDDAVGALVDELEPQLAALGAAATEAVDLAVLRRLYPLHPATLELLEEVRDRFSQARGVVDFAVGQLAGRPERGIEPFLDEPWGSLLTPDRIVDHFRDLFEVQPEFLPLAQKVLPYYRDHLERLVPAERARRLAERLLDLLVLVHLSPARDGLTAAEATAWLLPRVSRLTPEKNLAIVAGLLDTLSREGRFVARAGERYRLDVEEKDQALLERLLERARRETAAQPPATLFAELAGAAGGELAPTLTDAGWRRRQTRWFFHARPYAAFVGDGEPPELEEDGDAEVTLVVRPPWGDRAPARGHYTLRPRELEATPELVEAAALLRLPDTGWSADTARRLEERRRRGLDLFRRELEAAYLAASVADPEGRSESPPRLSSPLGAEALLDQLAGWALRRVYPAFEKFAPSHGPLPREAYRRFLAFATSHDLGAPDPDDDFVDLVREAYLAPMGLLKRDGRGYRVLEHPDRNELLRLVLPLVEHEPAPESVARHLAAPIYGLVRDQAALLLAFLALTGEADLLLRGTSLRDAWESQPDPLAYDRLVPGVRLGEEELRGLATLRGELGLSRVREWTPVAQRRAARELRRLAERERGRLLPLVQELGRGEEREELAARLEELLESWDTLLAGERELDAVKRFLARIGDPARFAADHRTLAELPERIARLGREVDRLRHLLGHPTFAGRRDPDLAARLEELGEPPPLARPERVDRWLERARALYDAYRRWYRERHDEHRKRLDDHPARGWRPPAVAASRQLGLDALVDEARERAARLERLRCSGLSPLDFQPLCTCGYDGETSPAAAELERLAALRREIEAALAGYFDDPAVRARVAEWLEGGLPGGPGTVEYVEGNRPWPEVAEPELFDRHLAGLEVVRELPAESLLAALEGKAWEPAAALAAVEELLARSGGRRIRFTRDAAGGAGGELLLWCHRQALAHGLRLPPAARRGGDRSAGECRPDQVGPAALRRLEELGLPDELADRVVGWLAEGRLAPPVTGDPSPLVRAAAELAHPTEPADADALAELAALLYRWAPRLLAAAAERARERLGGLATADPPEPPPPLTEALRRFEDHQWIVADGLGLPLLPTLLPRLGELLPGRPTRGWRAATVAAPTTTRDWYAALAENGVDHPFHKVEAVDRLLHEPGLDFAELERLAPARLGVDLTRLAPDLDPSRPLLLFADHGFRLAPDGRRLVHGGDSALERLVPLVELGTVEEGGAG